MRSNTQRITKYDKKIDSGVIGSRYDKVKDLAVSKEAAALPHQVELELKVKEIITNEPSIQYHFYMLFAKQFNKWGDDENRNILIDRWVTRGLNITLLLEIASKIFNWEKSHLWTWDTTSVFDWDRWN